MKASRQGLRVAGALIAFAGLLPVLPAWDFTNSHDTGRLLQGWLLLGCAIAFPAPRATISRGGASDALSLALFACALPACLLAASPLMAAREVLLLGGLGLAAYVTAEAGSTISARRDCARLIVAVCCSYGLVVMLIITSALVADAPLNNASLFVGYDNPRFLNHAQVVYMPLLAGIAIQSALGLRWRTMAALALTVNVAFLLFSIGRSAVLALACVTLLGLAFGASGRRWSAAMAASVVAGTLLYLLLFRLIPTQTDSAVNDSLNAGASLTSDHSRLYLWRIALDDIETHPWLGIGPMHFAHHPNRSGAHPHNFYLQIAAEFGLPFACLLFAMLGRALFKRLAALRRESASTDPLVFGAVMACCGAAIDALSSGNMVMPISQLWIAIAAGLAMSPVPVHALTAPAGRRRWPWLGVFLAAVYLVFAVNTTTTWIDKRRTASIQAQTVQQAVVPRTLRPRFWLDGWF